VNPYAFIDEFRAEAAEHLRTLDAQLLVLERSPGDLRPVRTMFLAAHSIKGGAAMLELAEARELAHALEDVLGSLRDGVRPLDPGAADVLFRTIDRLRALVDQPRTGLEVQPESAALVAELNSWSTGSAGSAPAVVGAEPSARGARVLLVEDSATVRLTETILLEEAGFAVDAVGDGPEALRRAEAAAYALVVVGAQTSGLTSPDLAAALRDAAGAGPRPAVLVTTIDQRTIEEHPDAAGYAPIGSLADATLVQKARALVGQGGL